MRECPPSGLCVWTLGPQLVALLWEAAEPLYGVGHNWLRCVIHNWPFRVTARLLQMELPVCHHHMTDHGQAQLTQPPAAVPASHRSGLNEKCLHRHRSALGPQLMVLLCVCVEGELGSVALLSCWRTMTSGVRWERRGPTNFQAVLSAPCSRMQMWTVSFLFQGLCCPLATKLLSHSQLSRLPWSWCFTMATEGWEHWCL